MEQRNRDALDRDPGQRDVEPYGVTIGGGTVTHSTVAGSVSVATSESPAPHGSIVCQLLERRLAEWISVVCEDPDPLASFGNLVRHGALPKLLECEPERRQVIQARLGGHAGLSIRALMQQAPSGVALPIIDPIMVFVLWFKGSNSE